MLGYFFGMITAFTAVVALAIGLFNITAAVNGPATIPVLKSLGRLRLRHNGTHRLRTKHHEQRMSLRSLPLPKRTLKKANITNAKCLPVSPTTTAMGTRWVMPNNLGTAQEVSSSADPALGVTRRFPPPWSVITHPARDDDVLPAFASAMLGRNVAPHFSPQDLPRLATIDAISWPSREFRSTCFSISIRAANSGPIFLFNSAIFSTSALAFFMSFS